MLTIAVTTSSLNLRVDRGGAVKFTLENLKVTETDYLGLAQRFVSAELNWGDGSPIVYLGANAPSATPIVVASPPVPPLPPQPAINIPVMVRSFSAGTYIIVISARNYREPVFDQTQKVITVNVVGETEPASDLGTIVGPILPRDSGYPNAAQWNFQVEEDILVLESSIRGILLTAKGERVMNPDFGTNLHTVVFEPDTGAVEALVREDILRAVATYEPRVALDSIQITRAPNLRQAEIRVTFISKLSSQPFQISMKYDR
jgi:phage baseplate assembly protein W